MNAGRLRNLITFERKVRTVQANQTTVISYAFDFNEWAAFEQTSETVARFTMRFRDGITPDSHHIIFDLKIWNITSAFPDERRRELIIDCDFSMMVEVTHLESPTREYIDGQPVLRPRDS